MVVVYCELVPAMLWSKADGAQMILFRCPCLIIFFSYSKSCPEMMSPVIFVIAFSTRLAVSGSSFRRSAEFPDIFFFSALSANPKEWNKSKDGTSYLQIQKLAGNAHPAQLTGAPSHSSGIGGASGGGGGCHPGYNRSCKSFCRRMS